MPAVICIALIGLLLGACGDTQAKTHPPPDFRYELSCGSIPAANGETPLLCVRLDTASGATWLVETMKLGVASPPVSSDALQQGRFAIECDATTANADGAFRCLRLDRVSGAIAVLPLKALPRFPDLQQPEPTAEHAAMATGSNAHDDRSPENQHP